MANVTLHQLTRTYANGVTALQPLDLQIENGEYFVVMGPSGSGKTTLLRLIAGLDTPTSGTIRIGGRDVTRLAPHPRDVAMVFQRPTVYPHLDVRSNLGFAARLRGTLKGPSLAERVESVAQELQVDHLLDRRADQLSGGERQRVALGRALVRQPAVLLLDEPLSQLEEGLRAELREYLHLLSRQRRTTIIHVTHDREEALFLGDRVALLDRGRLQSVASRSHERS